MNAVVWSVVPIKSSRTGFLKDTSVIRCKHVLMNEHCPWLYFAEGNCYIRSVPYGYKADTEYPVYYSGITSAR